MGLVQALILFSHTVTLTIGQNAIVQRQSFSKDTQIPGVQTSMVAKIQSSLRKCFCFRIMIFPEVPNICSKSDAF